MRVKKFLCGLFVASVVISLFVSSALALDPSGDWTVDWETSYMNLKDQDHHANYTPVQVYYNYGSLFHDAWVSTEVSVPANGLGYVFAEIRDTNGNTYASDLEARGYDGEHVTDGMLKLPAVYGDVNGAQYVRFAARQTVGINIDRKRVQWNNNKFD